MNHDRSRSGQRNLRAWCQAGHLVHDRAWHLLQRWISYRLRYARGDLFLGPYQHGRPAAPVLSEIWNGSWPGCRSIARRNRVILLNHRGRQRRGGRERLREHEAELKALGVEHLYLFGSIAGGDAGADSDVDLFFDHERAKLSLFGLMDLKEWATQILGRKTDIMTRDSLHKTLRQRIEAAAL